MDSASWFVSLLVAQQLSQPIVEQSEPTQQGYGVSDNVWTAIVGVIVLVLVKSVLELQERKDARVRDAARSQLEADIISAIEDLQECTDELLGMHRDPMSMFSTFTLKSDVSQMRTDIDAIKTTLIEMRAHNDNGPS